MTSQLFSKFQAWEVSRLGPPLRSALVSGGIAILFTLFIPNHFKSEGRILPDENRTSGGGIAAAASLVGLSLPGQESPDAAYVDIISSRWAFEKLLESDYKFSEIGWYFGSRTVREQKLIEYLKAKNKDDGVSKLKKRIKIIRDIKTKLLTISVETTSPELSQSIVSDLIKILNEFLVEKARTRGGIKAQFTSERLVEARAELLQAEDGFRIFLDKNRNYLLSPDPAVRLMGQRLDNEYRLKYQLLTNLAIAKEQALIEEKNDMPILNILDPGNLPIEKSYPPRSIIVLLFFLIGFIVHYVVSNKIKLKL